MRIQIASFGRLKTAGYADSASVYSQRLASQVQIEEIELKPLPVPTRSESILNQIRTKEADLLLSTLSKRGRPSRIFLLDPQGKAMPTEAWRDLVDSARQSGSPDIAFCIGSSIGFSRDMRCDGRISLGPQTMSHELSRVVLLEQLYRVFTLIQGHPYHHA